MHLLIDGHDGNPEILQNQSLISKFLEELPNKIGMTKLMKPQVNRYEGTNIQDWGISGFVIIAESHISVHTFPERKYINIDVFSCKNFDIEKTISQVKSYFKLEKVKSWTIDRGIDNTTPKEFNNFEFVIDKKKLNIRFRARMGMMPNLLSDKILSIKVK